jgi:hypothetical protein
MKERTHFFSFKVYTAFLFHKKLLATNEKEGLILG